MNLKDTYNLALNCDIIFARKGGKIALDNMRHYYTAQCHIFLVLASTHSPTSVNWLATLGFEFALAITLG